MMGDTSDESLKADRTTVTDTAKISCEVARAMWLLRALGGCRCMSGGRGDVGLRPDLVDEGVEMPDILKKCPFLIIQMEKSRSECESKSNVRTTSSIRTSPQLIVLDDTEGEQMSMRHASSHRKLICLKGPIATTSGGKK
jgi:hypothetical protein